mmetsp:Transcript_27360/g.63117  ORF Transcript_27360/g.63117 Transcript_27360/m.63117 type:complete len:174 (+) Transcript_27360:63-584(+)
MGSTYCCNKTKSAAADEYDNDTTCTTWPPQLDDRSLFIDRPDENAGAWMGIEAVGTCHRAYRAEAAKAMQVAVRGEHSVKDAAKRAMYVQTQRQAWSPPVVCEQLYAAYANAAHHHHHQGHEGGSTASSLNREHTAFAFLGACEVIEVASAALQPQPMQQSPVPAHASLAYLL